MRCSSTARSEAMRACSIDCARRDLRPLGLLLLVGALAGDLGPLGRALRLELALLRQPRILQLAVDVERLPLGVEILVADLDHRVLLDVVADLLAPLDLLGQARQALGVEGVGRVEELHGRLVELGQRHGLELEAVLQQVGRDHGAHALDVFAALLVHLLHRHLGRHGAQRVDELALDQLLSASGCMVRWPSVWAAAAMASSDAWTRT